MKFKTKSGRVDIPSADILSAALEIISSNAAVLGALSVACPVDPPDGWTCFHCGETFKTWNGARDHFGATPDETPLCLIAHRGSMFMLARRARNAEATARAAHAERNRAEEKEAAANQSLAELFRLFPGARTVNDVRTSIDFMNGRCLTAESIVREAEAAAPAVIEAAREIVCRYPADAFKPCNSKPN
jgi:hypothetical protein